MIKPALQFYFDSLLHLDTLLLSVNVDGLSITNSSKSSFWPILISFINIPILAKIVLLVGSDGQNCLGLTVLVLVLLQDQDYELLCKTKTKTRPTLQESCSLAVPIYCNFFLKFSQKTRHLV